MGTRDDCTNHIYISFFSVCQAEHCRAFNDIAYIRLLQCISFCHSHHFQHDTSYYYTDININATHMSHKRAQTHTQVIPSAMKRLCLWVIFMYKSTHFCFKLFYLLHSWIKYQPVNEKKKYQCRSVCNCEKTQCEYWWVWEEKIVTCKYLSVALFLFILWLLQAVVHAKHFSYARLLHSHPTTVGEESHWFPRRSQHCCNAWGNWALVWVHW